MPEQNYANHKRFVPLYHFILFGLLALSLIGSIVNLVESFSSRIGIYSASLIFMIFVCLLLVFYFVRSFPLKVQDRIIRLEENFRSFIITGKTLDPKLTIRQIIGLRFASNNEFVALAQKAASENISEDDIKKLVKNWQADKERM